MPVIATTSNNKTGNTNADLTFTFSADGPVSGLGSNAPDPGDLYIAVVTVACYSLAVTPVFSATSLWVPGPESKTTTLLRHGTASFYKRMIGNETSLVLAATPNGTGAGMVGKIIRIAKDTYDPAILGQATAATTASVANLSVAGVTTLRPDALVMYFAGIVADNARTATWAAGVTELWDFSTDPGDAATNTMAQKQQTVQGATGAFVATPSASAPMSGICIAVENPVGGWGEIPAF